MVTIQFCRETLKFIIKTFNRTKFVTVSQNAKRTVGKAFCMLNLANQSLLQLIQELWKSKMFV